MTRAIIRTFLLASFLILVMAAFVFVVNVPHLPVLSNSTSDIDVIRLMMRSYRLAKGRRVPAYTIDASGKRLHSWRVLVLPFKADNKQMAKGYRYDRPWDSEENIGFVEKIPGFFQPACARTGTRKGMTDYVAILSEKETVNSFGRTIPLVSGVRVVHECWLPWTAPFDSLQEWKEYAGKHEMESELLER